jgi:kynurenine aminotransferase
MKSLKFEPFFEHYLAVVTAFIATLAAKTRILFCSNTPMQEAVVMELEQANDRGFFGTASEQRLMEYQERRDIFCRYRDKLGLIHAPRSRIFQFFSLLRMSYTSSCKFTICEGYFCIEIPDDYKFPASLAGRRRDFRG